MFARADPILSPAEMGGVVVGRGFGLSGLVVVVSPPQGMSPQSPLGAFASSPALGRDPSGLLRGLDESVEHSQAVPGVGATWLSRLCEVLRDSAVSEGFAGSTSLPWA